MVRRFVDSQNRRVGANSRILCLAIAVKDRPAAHISQWQCITLLLPPPDAAPRLEIRPHDRARS